MIIIDQDRDLRAALVLEVLDKEHSNVIEQLRCDYSHTITFVTDGEPRSRCISYVFGLDQDANYFNDPCATTDFVLWLRNNEHLKEIPNPQEQCFVCYFLRDKCKHIGVMVSGKVTSKWGTYPIYSHGLAEVPCNYGNEVKFYETTLRQDALKRLYWSWRNLLRSVA
jgi:hypothetical protein